MERKNIELGAEPGYAHGASILFYFIYLFFKVMGLIQVQSMQNIRGYY